MYFPIIAWVALVAPALSASSLHPENQQWINPDYMKPAGSRSFRIQYAAKVQEVPADTQQLRIWLPVPQNSSVQTISSLSFSPEPKLISTEPKYGNRIAYWVLANPGSNVQLTMTFTCTRKEVRMDLQPLATDASDPPAAFDVFKGEDALVIIDDEIRNLARQIAGDKRGALAKTRAIYDHVLEKMTYDKNHDGWGLGSTRHACELGKGNCTDFHALFNSLCRAQGIASGFEIGLYLPYEWNRNEPLGGYHCWALFRVPGKSWVPVDCSEADRYPEKKDYFFGGHSNNRATLSTGRDLILEPKQAGPPLNFFLDPYAEADGKPVRTDKGWSYKDLNVSVPPGGRAMEVIGMKPTTSLTTPSSPFKMSDPVWPTKNFWRSASGPRSQLLRGAGALSCSAGGPLQQI